MFNPRLEQQSVMVVGEVGRGRIGALYFRYDYGQISAPSLPLSLNFATHLVDKQPELTLMESRNGKQNHVTILILFAAQGGLNYNGLNVKEIKEKKIKFLYLKT